MNRLLLTALLLGVFFSAKGQVTTSNDTLRWSENRPLTWNDFKGEPMEGVGLDGEIFCMNFAGFKKPSAFQKTKFNVASIFDRTKSWVNSNSKSDVLLTYFQVMFNIYEVHARSLRKDLAMSKFGPDPSAEFQEKYNTSMTNLVNEFNQLKRESRMGSDSKSVASWKIKVDEELKSLEEYKK